MTILFLIVCMLALFHFYYQSVVAPTLILFLRFRLFALRDELRGIMIEEAPDVPSALYVVENSINTAIRILHSVTISGLLYADSQIRNHVELQRRIEERNDLIANCQIPKVKEIERQASTLVAGAFLANSGGWFIYLLPIALTWASFSGLFQLLKRILVIKESEFEVIVPEFCPA